MEYLDRLYAWLLTQDDTFKDAHTPDSFKEKMRSNDVYREDMYKWIVSQDPSFMSPEEFTQKTKATAPPVNEPEKKKAGLTGMESSSEDGSSGFTASEGILPEYLKPQPKPQSPYQIGMEPGSYGQKQLAAEQAMEDEYQAASQQAMEEVAPVLGQLQPEQLAGKGPVKPSTPEERVDRHFQEQAKEVTQMTDEEIAQAYKQAEDQLRNEDPRAIQRGVPADKYVPDYIKQERAARAKKEVEYRRETESMLPQAQERINKQLKAEEDARRLANQIAAKDPEFASALAGLNADMLSKSEEELVPKLNDMFRKYGMFFEESGWGTDNVMVSTRDGKNSIEIPIGDAAKTDPAGALKQISEFIYANAMPSEQMDDDFISNALKAKKMRPTAMRNPDGTMSTVMFTSSDNMVFPTIFPKGDKPSTNPKDWIDFGDDTAGALAEARKRGEVLTLRTPDDANRFAAGEWKDVDQSYILGKKYYAERGLDYVEERRKFERFNDVQDEIDVIQNIMDGKIDNIPYSERSRFPEYFGPDGRPLYHSRNQKTRDFMSSNLSRLSSERDVLLEQVYDNEFMQDGKVTLAREGFDLELEKKRQEVISEAVKINAESKEKLNKLNESFEAAFNVPITEISKVVPKTPQEAETLDVSRRALENITFAKQNAAAKFEESKTYLDAKWNKKANKEYIENFTGFATAVEDAWYRGQAAEEILWATMGLYDVEDPTDRAALAKAIAEYQAAQSGESSLSETRYKLSRGGGGWKAFYADPFEYTATIVATSIGQMLPYGLKIVPTTTATGAAAGAGVGAVGGAGVGALPGAISGGGYGFAAGMAATSLAVEYTNSIFDVMREKGYDLLDPKQVEEALLNEDVWSEGGERGLKRGIPIALVDFLAKGVAGRVFNVAKTASLPVKIGAQVAERTVFDPVMEGVGEFAAQAMAGQDIDWSEIGMESLGGLGNNVSTMGFNMYRDAKSNSNQSHAYTLATDMNAMAMERSSDERITQWANNLRQLGKIDEDVQQQILKNVGLRREAKDVLKPVTGRFGNKEVEARMMELMAANEQMSATQNRKMAFKDKISQVKSEISRLAETGQMVPEEERAQIENFAAPTKKILSKYVINGEVMTRAKFEQKLESMDAKRMLRSRVQVLGDEETKQKYDAIFKQKTGQVLVREQAGPSETVEGEVSQAGLEEAAGEAEVQEEGLTAESAEQDLVTSRLRLDELNESIPEPAKRWTNKMTSETLTEEESAPVMSFLAGKVASGAKLSPNQQKVYDANKQRVDELSRMISERNDLNSEVESLTEAIESMGKAKPEAAADVDAVDVDAAVDADFDVTEAVDEEGEVDYDAEEQVRTIAKKRGLGITSDREIAFVARDKQGNVIGGAFRSFDQQSGTYTFDVVVDENAEGKGIGSKLLDAVREVPSDIREMNPKAKVEIDVVNPAMKKMLLKRGYKVKERLGGDRVLMTPIKRKTKPKTEAATNTGSGVNVADRAAIEALSGRVNTTSKGVVSQAARALSILKKVFPDIEVFVHDDPASYNEAMKTEKGRADSAGNISRRAGNKFRIDINLSKANERTVPHEVAHAMIYKAFGDKPALFKEFRDKVTKMLSVGSVVELNDFASMYAETESHEEFLVELAAALSVSQSQITKSMAQKIATLINRVVERLTGGWVPFKGAVTVNEIVDFLNGFTNAMNEEITEEIEENMSEQAGAALAVNIDMDVVSRSSMRPKRNFKVTWNVNGIDIVHPGEHKSMYDALTESGGAAVIINSDATGVGINKMNIELQGGIGYTFIKDNVEDNVGFAASAPDKIKSFYTAVADAAKVRDKANPKMKGKPVAVFVMVQEPEVMYGNVYGAEYFGRALKALAEDGSISVDAIKEQISRYIDKFSKSNKKGRDYSVSLNALKNLINESDITTQEGIDKIVSLAVTNEGITLKKEGKRLGKFGFDLRREFLSKFFVNLADPKKNEEAVEVRKKLKQLGFNTPNFVSEHIDGNINELLDGRTPGQRLKDGGFSLTGFYVNPYIKKDAYIEKSNSGKYKHKQFNAKFHGENAFVLDGKYYVNDIFPEARMWSKKKNDWVPVNVSAAGSLYPRVKHGFDEVLKRAKAMDEDVAVPEEVVSKSQVAVDEYNSASKENKDDVRSKSRVAIHDDTGFVSVDFWVENLSGKTKYLDKVIESILKSRDVLKSGKVSPERVAKAFLITIASKGSGGGYYSTWSNKTGKKVSDLFLETQDGKFWIRPESAAAAYLATPEGDSLVKSLINKTATDEQVKSFVDFLGFGFENSKTEDILGTMNSDGINKMTSLFNQNKGTDSAKLYDGAIKYLRGVAEGKTGFFNQFIGVSGRGVVDARELNAWIAGQMKLTEEQKAFKQKVAQSKKLSNVILDRIEQVGLKLGYSKEFASYIAHHAIWDGIKNSVTTHEGIYDVVSKSQKDMTTEEEVVSFSQQPFGVNTMRGIIKTGRENGYSDAAIKQVLKNKGYKVADINAEMTLNVNPFTLLPTEFADVVGGAKEGLKLFRRVRHKLARWKATNPKKPTEIQSRAMAIELLKSDPIFLLQDKTTQMRLITSFDSSVSNQVGTRIQRAMDRLISDLKTKQRVIAEKELTAAKVRLRNIVSEMLPGVDVISAKRASNIMGIIANATQNSLLSDLEKIYPMIEKERELMHEEAMGRLKTLLVKKAKKAKTKSGKVRSDGLDEVGQAFFEVAKRVLSSMTSKDKYMYDKYVSAVEEATLSGRIGDLLLKQEAGDELTLEESDIVNAAIALDLFEDLLAADVEQVNDIVSALEMMRGESIKRLKLARMVRSNEYKAIAALAERQIQTVAPELFNPDGSMRDAAQERSQIKSNLLKGRVFKALKKLNEQWKYVSPANAVKNFFRNQLLHVGAISESLDNNALGLTFFKDNVYRPLNRAREAALSGYYRQMDILDSMANTIPGVTKGYKQIKRLISDGKVIEVTLEAGERTVVKDGKKVKEQFDAGGKLNMTKDMMLRAYALSLNEVQREKLRKMGIDDKVIEFIKFELGSEPVAFANLLVEYMSEDYFNSLNDTYKFINNVNLGHVSNFFPVITKPVEVGSDMIQDGNFSGVFNADTAPSLKERVDTTGEVDINFDFTDVVDEYFKAMERYKAFAWPVNKINAIFKNKAVNEYITQLGVKQVYKKLINRSINPNAGAKPTSTILSWFARKYTGYALSFRGMQILKQMVSSYPNAFEDYSYFGKDSKVPGFIKTPVDLMMFTVDSAIVMATLPKWLKMAYSSSAEFRNRWDSGVDGDIYGLTTGARVYVPIDKAMNWKGNLKRAYTRAGGMPTMIGDFGGLSSYLVNYRRDIMNGMSKEDAIEKFNDYNATAQSKRETEKNALQMSDNEFSRTLFTMFSSTAFLQINKIYVSTGNIWKSMRAGKMPKAKDIRALVLSYAVSNALFVAASNIFKLMSGTKDDEEEVLNQVKEALMGAELLKQIPGFGVSIEKGMATYDLYMAETSEEKEAARKKLFFASTDAIDPLSSIIDKVSKGLKKDDYVMAAKPVFELLIGAQVDPVIGIHNMFSEGFDEDNMYDVIGVSSSYRPSKPEPGKPPEAMSKEDMKKYLPEYYDQIYMNDEALETNEEIDRINKEVEEIEREAMDAAFGYEGD